jgi:uncharacterized protein YdaU (DUF1376 family)
MQHSNSPETVNRFSTPSRRAPSSGNRTPFLMLFGEDFLSGCRKAAMTPEQVGMYIFMLILEWTDKAPLDDDMRRLSARTGWDVRICRRLTGQLVDLGKYHHEEGHLSNDRMQSEIEHFVKKQQAKEAKFSHISGRSPADPPDQSPRNETPLTGNLPGKDNENNGAAPKTAGYTRARNIQNQNHKERGSSNSSVANRDEVAALPRVDLGDLSDRLLAACNGALDNPVNCMGLLNMSIPQMWLERGADLERDVLPTLEAAGKRYHGKRIRDWNYFTGMITEARTRREAALEAPAPDTRESEAEKRKAVLKAQRDKLRKEFGWTEEATTHG